MIRRILLFLAVAGCHSVTIRVDRGSSAAIERDDKFIPLADAGGRFISEPPTGLIDCPDLLVSDNGLAGPVGIKPCADSQGMRHVYQLLRHGTGDGAALRRWQALGHAPMTVRIAADASLSPAPEDGRYVVVGLLRAPFVQTKGVVVAHVAGGKLVGLGRVLVPQSVKLTPLPVPEASAAFIHVSDGQIREPEAKLGGAKVSGRLDPLVQSFEHEYEQELYSGFVYRAVVATINAEVRRLWHKRTARLAAIAADGPLDAATDVMPSAVIHTGDAVDAGLQSEFDDFRASSDRLSIPWYQAVGNHDLLAFGNLQLVANGQRTPSQLCEGAGWKDVACTCTPVSDLVREYNLRRPDNKGCEAEGVPSKAFTLVPLFLERVCVRHEIAADHFLMDPYPPGSYTVAGKIETGVRPQRSLNTFVAAHHRNTPHRPKPEWAPAPRGWPDYAARAPRPRAAGTEAIDPDPCGTVAPDGGTVERSELNGFDLHWFVERAGAKNYTNALDLASRDALASHDESARGYYCFELEQEPGTAFAKRGRMWAFVLNTSTPGGAYGEMSVEQLAWLERRLAKTEPQDLVFVFAHHPIWGIFDAHQRKTLLTILGRQKNVVAYFAGHTHDSQLRVVHPPDGHHRFWEVIAPSTLVFPQQARMVTVRTAGKIGWLDVVSFSPASGGVDADKLARALKGAKRDTCHQTPHSCDDGEPRPPAREVTFPRLYFQLPDETTAAGVAATLPTDVPTEGQPYDCRQGWTPPRWIDSARYLLPPRTP